MRRVVIYLSLLMFAAAAWAAVTNAQTPQRAVIAGTLIEDKDGDGTLNAGDGGAQTLVQLMQRSTDGGYKCVDFQMSDRDGKFRFEDLSIADYELMIWWLPGFFDGDAGEDTLTLSGTSDELRSGLQTYSLRLKQNVDNVVPFPMVKRSRTAATSCKGLDNPAMPQNICQKTGPEVIDGPSSFDDGQLRYALPGGTFMVWDSQPPSTPAQTICYYEGNSSLTVSSLDGHELAREVNTPAGAAVVEAIAASLRFDDSEPVRTPVVSATRNRPGSGEVIQPPDTGDGGLLREK